MSIHQRFDADMKWALAELKKSRTSEDKAFWNWRISEIAEIYYTARQAKRTGVPMVDAIFISLNQMTEDNRREGHRQLDEITEKGA